VSSRYRIWIGIALPHALRNSLLARTIQTLLWHRWSAQGRIAHNQPRAGDHSFAPLCAHYRCSNLVLRVRSGCQPGSYVCACSVEETPLPLTAQVGGWLSPPARPRITRPRASGPALLTGRQGLAYCLLVCLLQVWGCKPPNHSHRKLGSELQPAGSTVGCSPSDSYSGEHVLRDVLLVRGPTRDSSPADATWPVTPGSDDLPARGLEP